MAYFGGGSRSAGDPGFFGSFAKFALKKLVPGGGIATGLLAKFQQPTGGIAIPRITGRGGRTPAAVGPNGELMKRRRRMNVGNTKALRRAIRRTDGFVRVARSALKNTGFKIVSKSAGKVSQASLRKAVAAAHHAK